MPSRARPTAKAITDRGHCARIDIDVLREQLLCCVEPGAHQRDVAAHLRKQLGGALWVMRLLAIAVHIKCDGDVTRAREFFRACACVLIVSPPFVHDKNGGSTTGECVVFRDEPFEPNTSAS